MADDALEHHGALLDEQEREFALTARRYEAEQTELAAAVMRVLHQAEPVQSLVVRLGVLAGPGESFEDDVSYAVTAALARRTVCSLRGLTLEERRADAHTELLDWLESRLGSWPVADWEAAVTTHVERTIEAMRRGRERGARLAGDQAASQPADEGWLLRHPADHWAGQARERTSDPALQAHLDRFVAESEPSYRALAGRCWVDETAAADVVCGVQIGPPPRALQHPLPATVTRVEKGAMAVGERIALKQVEGRPFNGLRINALCGECWHLVGVSSDPATLWPSDGTHRLAHCNEAGRVLASDSARA